MDSIPWKHILGDKLVGAERVELHPMVEAALVFIETNGLNTQGLFRVPGSASQVKALKESFKTKKKVPDLSETEPNTVCSLLTDHLRSEEPLLTYALAPRWLQAAGLPDLVVRLTKYVDLINQLPVLNHATLFAMLRLLVLISQHAEKTLMPATNLGTIFGPMICRRLNSDIAQELSDIPAVSKLCIDLITHFSQLFDYYDLDPSASSAAAGSGGFNDSLSVDSPRTKKTTRRKFQFGKDKPFHGERSGGTASPSPGSSAGGSGSPSSTSALAAAASALGSSNSPIVPLQSPLVPAPEYDPPATGGDEGGRDQPGRTRKNAVYGREDRLNDQLGSELSEGGQPRSPKSARGLLGSISLDADEDDSRPEGGARMDGKSVMRSLSSMGGFYAKGVSKPLAVGDLETVHSSAAAATAQPDAEEFPEEEGKDADGKKDKKRLPALNLKKRKNSVDKKKLRMFSPRKLFDKDRPKASPDSSCDSSDLERKYDGSSSSEREEPTRRFGGRKIPFRSPRRKSSSWPEAELAELRHRTDQAASHDDDSDLNDDSDSDDYDGSGADSSGAETPTSTSSSLSSLPGGSEPKSRAKSDLPPGEAHSLEIAAVVRTEKRKGSQSERGPSASARAAARAGKSLAGASSATSISPRAKRPDLPDGDERPLSPSTSNAPKIWMASAPRPPNAATTNILLKSPRVVGTMSAAAALDETLRGQEAIAGHLAPEEELGLVKWRRRMTAGSTRRRPASNVHAVVAEGGGGRDDDSENGETEENDGLRQPQVEAPTTGVAFLLSKYYLYNNDNTGGGGASNGVDTRAAENDNKQTPQKREREKEKELRERERDGGGAESEGDTENDDEVDDDGGTTTEDEGSSGGSGNGSSHGGSSGEEKGRRRRNSGAAEGKPRRRRSSSARKHGGGSGNKKATTAVKDSSGLKLGRKVRRGEEQVSEDEEDDHHLAPPAKASPVVKRVHSPRPRASEDHIGGNSITID